VVPEARHADAGVVGAEHLDEELLLEGQAAVEGDVEAAVDGPLARAWAATAPAA